MHEEQHHKAQYSNVEGSHALPVEEKSINTTPLDLEYPLRKTTSTINGVSKIYKKCKCHMLQKKRRASHLRKDHAKTLYIHAARDFDFIQYLDADINGAF